MIVVWDRFVRIFHWSLVAIVLLNRFGNDGGGDWHEWLGYAACALIVARIAWAFVARNPYSRVHSLREIWPSRAALLPETRKYLAGRAPRTIGHPPLAQIGMIAMLLCITLLGMTGWMLSWDAFFGEESMELLHELFSNVLLGLAILHVIGVVRESILHRENLVTAMIHGKKRSGSLDDSRR